MLPLYLEGLGDPLEIEGRQVVKGRVGRKSGRIRGAAALSIQSLKQSFRRDYNATGEAVKRRSDTAGALSSPPSGTRNRPAALARYRPGARSGILERG